MKTFEYNHNGNSLDRLLNSWPFCLDTEKIIPVWAFAFCKGLTGWRKWPVNNDSLFYNGLLFIRIMRPFWIGWSIRLGKRYLQAGIGWKLNGRFDVIFPFRLTNPAHKARMDRIQGMRTVLSAVTNRGRHE